MSTSLTPKQRRLKKELEAISEIVRVDYWNILTWPPRLRTTALEVMTRQLIRGDIVTQYTLIDDWLSSAVCRYFLPGRSFIVQWKTQRFVRFNYYVIERLYMTQKLAFLKDAYVIPKAIAATIEEINALRNAMAHAFFPENLRAYHRKGPSAARKPVTVRYKGTDIFTLEGIRQFAADCGTVTEFFKRGLRRRTRTLIALRTSGEE
ncbi:MAG: hypothetical protein HY010_03365 [Acidobacteria bacterium]|nr:hypothetical protein [Acidobacteriota bacterium]